MNRPSVKRLSVESGALILLSAGLVVSVVLLAGKMTEGNRRLEQKRWLTPGHEAGVAAGSFQALETARETAENPVQFMPAEPSLFSSELRVVAIGSGYPIPYEAEVCPFSNIPQPSMDRLDRDGDGMTDDWELKFGFDKYDAHDAFADRDGDGFSNLEEFRYGTDPLKRESHPPFALKMRFVERKDVPFPLVFQGSVDLPDGRQVFQVNTPADGKTHFKALGEDVENIVLQRFIPAGPDGPARLIVLRNAAEIELVLGQKTADPESQAELINILDQSSRIVTMGALLSLYDDTYTVLGAYPDRVVLKHIGTGEVFDIVSEAEGEE